MRTHPEKGYGIVANMPGMQQAAEIVLCHEERYDGSGYEAIPWDARLFAVIATLDAMTSDRPYRKALPFEAAEHEPMSLSGSQFEPAAVALFLDDENSMREMVALKCGSAHVRDLFHQ